MKDREVRTLLYAAIRTVMEAENRVMARNISTFCRCFTTPGIKENITMALSTVLCSIPKNEPKGAEWRLCYSFWSR